MQSQVERAAEKSAKITGVRGIGTSVWIDTNSHQTTQELYACLRDSGVLVKLNGARGVMTKPALTLEESQISPLTQALMKF